MEKKVFKVLIMVAVLVIAITTVVQAASFTATMTPSSTSVAPETEFTVRVKISNLDVGQNGINSLSGFLKYDDDVFEVINDSSIEGVNEWKPNFSSENGKITLTKMQFVKTEEEVFNITFKTKAAADMKKKTSGTITLSSVVASNSEQDITASDVSTTITISSNATGNTTTNNTTNNALVIRPNNTTNSTINNSTNKVVNNTTNNTVANNTVVGANTNTSKNIVNNTSVSTYGNTTDEEELAYTGVEDTIIYVLFAVIAMALVFYIKFEKINRDIR